MTRRVVEEKQALGIPLGQPLKDIHCVIDLREKVVGSEPAIAILPSLEKNTRVPADDPMREDRGGIKGTHSFPFSSRRRPHSEVRKSETIIDCPSPLGIGAALSEL